MINDSDIKTYARDLFYTQEDILKLLSQTRIPKKIRDQLHDNCIKKQVILTKILNLISQVSI